MIKKTIQNPYIAIVVALVLMVVGAQSYTQTPTDLLPTFKTSAMQILTFYPGMPPEVMETDIMSRMQRWTGQSMGISHQEGKAMMGVCIVKDYFHEDVSMAEAMSQVSALAMSDMFYLPPGTIPPMVMPFDPTASVPLCLITVSSPVASEKQLYDIAYYDLRNKLQSISGVIAPAVYGGKLRRIMAYLDREKLESRGLSPLEVANALKEQNVFIPAGFLRAGTTEFQIFTNAMPEKVADINNYPITERNGRIVYFKDVGHVEDSSSIQTNIVRINGTNAAYIPIYRQPGSNTIQIVDSIKNSLPDILTTLRSSDSTGVADTIDLSVVLDQSVYVRESVKGLQIAAGLGAILAALIVMFFLRSFASTFIIVLAIPISVLAAFIVLYFSSNSINSMTLGGLALAIGILVDQSIVVLENIVRHIRMGKTPIQASLDGTKEVALPILVSTLTFCVVFFPVVFLSGMAKFLFTPLAVAAIGAIIASYLISISLIPAYCAYFLNIKANAPGHEDHMHGKFLKTYAAFLGQIIRMRFLVYPAIIALLVFSLFLLQKTGSELFPPVDAGQFQVFVRLPSGTRIEETERRIKQVEGEIIEAIGKPDPSYIPEEASSEKQPESNLKLLISNIGVLMDWPAAYTPNTGDMDAFCLVQLKNKKNMPGSFDSVQALRKRLNDKFPDMEFSFDTGGILTAALNQGEPAPIHVQVQGHKMHKANEAASVVMKEMGGIEGLTDIRVSQRLDYPIYRFVFDREKAILAGITAEDIVKNMVTVTNSSVNFAPAFWIAPNGNHYFLGAQYPLEKLESIDALRDVPITGSNGKTVKLGQLGEFHREMGPAVVNHVNIQRVIDVYANVLPGYRVGTLVDKIEKRLKISNELELTSVMTARGEEFDIAGKFKGEGLKLRATGEAKEMRNAFDQFKIGIILAIILIYLVMVPLFRSFISPLVIMLSIPLGFIGVGLLLYLTNTALNIQSFMGIIMMAGIVVEYGIILVDFANRLVEEGQEPLQAAITASCVRLRPILMTSLTTLLAILPMAFGFGGGEANIPLARTIVGGVLAATVLTLFVIPCFYVTFTKAKKANNENKAPDAPTDGGNTVIPIQA